MTKLVYAGAELEAAVGETVLNSLLRHGYAIPNNCRIGVCQSCLLKAISGHVPDIAQRGLKDTLRAQNYFLACQCVPTTSLEMMLPAPEMQRIAATVVSVRHLSETVVQLRLRPEAEFTYQAGQYVMLWNLQEIGRCYSLASVPGIDDTLEMHIARVVGGYMSTWVFDALKPGCQVALQSAIGDCFYTQGNPEEKLLLAGTGTGLAPLWGIARAALHQGHRGDIHVVHGAIDEKGLYLHNELTELARTFENFFYHASVMQGDQSQKQVSIGHIEMLIAEIVPNPKEWKIYLCGAQDMVNLLKRKMFLAGASMNNIYSDSFVSVHSAADAFS